MWASSSASRRVLPPPESESEKDGFAEVGLVAWVQEACRTMGLKEPTAIQRACIPRILAREDVLGLAETGSGKTAAFALPMLQMLFKEPYGVFGLVLSPARELAAQTAEQFEAFGARQKVRVATIVGGVDATQQALDLERRPHIIVATPGRLVDHLRQLERQFSRLRTLVLDEADRLVSPSFSEDLGTILATLKAIERTPHQTLFFSATSTERLDRLVDIRERPLVRVDLSAPAAVPAKLCQQYLFMPARVKVSYFVQLLKVLDVRNNRSAMIFVQTCRRCHELDALLAELKVPAICLHSKLGQRRRNASLGKFKSHRASVIVCTDVASRGLDIPRVDLVVNFDVPRDPDDYVHRVGRTGRAGRPGRAVTLVTQHDLDLVKAIEARVQTTLDLCDDVQEDDVLRLLNPVSKAIATAAIKRPWEDLRPNHNIKRARRHAPATTLPPCDTNDDHDDAAPPSLKTTADLKHKIKALRRRRRIVAQAP